MWTGGERSHPYGARRLEANGHVGAAARLREGREDTLTVLTLGRPPRLRRLFTTTTCIENVIGLVRHATRNLSGCGAPLQIHSLRSFVRRKVAAGGIPT